MIRKVSISDFKSLRDVRVQMDRFTVFVKPDAAGKSSILQAMNLLCRCFRAQAPQPENEIALGVSRGAENGVELAAESDGQWFRYRTQSRSAGNGPILKASRQKQLNREVLTDLNSDEGKPWTPTGDNSSPPAVSTAAPGSIEANSSPSGISGPDDDVAGWDRGPCGPGEHGTQRPGFVAQAPG